MQKDTLVDAFNRKAITDYIKNAIEESGERFTILLFDIDNFKGINAQEGHLAGDKVLKKITQIAKENIRSVDILGRYGGDEFLIFLPGTTASEAKMIAERFRKHADAHSGSTVSIGIASFPEDGKTIQELIDIADKGMYESKNSGKNAVTHYR
jgi:diguanylate cyclase (GGDEF)-like protein